MISMKDKHLFQSPCTYDHGLLSRYWQVNGSNLIVDTTAFFYDGFIIFCDISKIAEKYVHYLEFKKNIIKLPKKFATSGKNTEIQSTDSLCKSK